MGALEHFVPAYLLSRIQLFVSLWTVAYQAPLSLGFCRQECWSGLPFSPPGDLSDPGTEHTFPVSPSMEGGFFTSPVGMKNMLPLWNNPVWQFFNKLGLELLPLLSIHPRELKTYAHNNLYANIHSSIIHKSQKVEITQMSISWWIDKQMWSSQTMEYCLAITKMRFWYMLQHGWTWKTLH